jgi:hypothetical protein
VGLNLLFLIVENRMGAFHSEVRIRALRGAGLMHIYVYMIDTDAFSPMVLLLSHFYVLNLAYE